MGVINTKFRNPFENRQQKHQHFQCQEGKGSEREHRETNNMSNRGEQAKGRHNEAHVCIGRNKETTGGKGRRQIVLATRSGQQTLRAPFYAKTVFGFF